jgi:uncharacterized protein with ATP-grasp and redox domains
LDNVIQFRSRKKWLGGRGEKNMKIQLDCLPCGLLQALKAARAATHDNELHQKVIRAAFEMIPQLPKDMKPPEMTQKIYRLVYEVTGNDDPYRSVKSQENELALKLYPRLREVLAHSEDPLFTACELAIAANSIDFAPINHREADAREIIDMAFSQQLAVNDYEQFRSNVLASQRIVYIGDNCGEIVFDRLLIEEIRKVHDVDITFVVRERPIMNDATRSDAEFVGINKVARVISSGSDAPATILSQCSAEMLERYHAADMIISKGQGNQESLDEEKGNIFFLLKSKCAVAAKQLGASLGDAVLRQQHR